MKKKIKIAVDYKQVVTKEVEIDLPEENKYYASGDLQEETYLSLFAILLKHKSAGNYILLEVKRNFQSYTDFIPNDDCKEFWWVDYNPEHIRKKAYEIISQKSLYKEVTKEQFDKYRDLLINNYKNKY